MKTISQCIFLRKQKETVLDEKTIFIAVEKCIQEQYGKQGSLFIYPIAWKKKVLVLEVTRSVWKSEVWQQRESLCRCVNAYFSPQEPIQKIVVK